MTLSSFIQSKLGQFGIELSSNELTALFIDNSLNESDDYETTKAKKLLYSIIPELLVKPSISEGGYSVKYDSNSLVSYYNLLCSDLGLENKLIKQPKVHNASNRW